MRMLMTDSPKDDPHRVQTCSCMSPMLMSFLCCAGSYEAGENGDEPDNFSLLHISYNKSKPGQKYPFLSQTWPDLVRFLVCLCAMAISSRS